MSSLYSPQRARGRSVLTAFRSTFSRPNTMRGIAGSEPTRLHVLLRGICSHAIRRAHNRPDSHHGDEKLRRVRKGVTHGPRPPGVLSAS